VLARELRAERDPGMKVLVDACVSADPAQRPADGDALLRALTAAR
jgi:hypothetical protein